MRIADLYTRDVIHVSSATPVRDAADVMRRTHVGALVVVEQVDGGPLPVGIVTDRDIVLGVVAAGADPAMTTAGDIMSRNLAVCEDTQDLFDAVMLMRNRGVRRLPVIDARGVLVGMFTADDAIGVIGELMRELTRATTREQTREMESPE